MSIVAAPGASETGVSEQEGIEAKDMSHEDFFLDQLVLSQVSMQASKDR